MKLFQTNINQIKKVYDSLHLSQKLNKKSTQVLLGQHGHALRMDAMKKLQDAITLLNQIG